MEAWEFGEEKREVPEPLKLYHKIIINQFNLKSWKEAIVTGRSPWIGFLCVWKLFYNYWRTWECVRWCSECERHSLSRCCSPHHPNMQEGERSTVPNHTKTVGFFPSLFSFLQPLTPTQRNHGREVSEHLPRQESRTGLILAAPQFRHTLSLPFSWQRWAVLVVVLDVTPLLLDQGRSTGGEEKGLIWALGCF